MNPPSFQEADIYKPGVMHNRDMMVVVTRPDYERLKNDYRYAMAEGFDSFIFMDREILTTYAKWMIEYLGRHFDS